MVYFNWFSFFLDGELLPWVNWLEALEEVTFQVNVANKFFSVGCSEDSQPDDI